MKRILIAALASSFACLFLCWSRTCSASPLQTVCTSSPVVPYTNYDCAYILPPDTTLAFLINLDGPFAFSLQGPSVLVTNTDGSPLAQEDTFTFDWFANTGSAPGTLLFSGAAPINIITPLAPVGVPAPPVMPPGDYWYGITTGSEPLMWWYAPGPLDQSCFLSAGTLTCGGSQAAYFAAGVVYTPEPGTVELGLLGIGFLGLAAKKFWT